MTSKKYRSKRIAKINPAYTGGSCQAIKMPSTKISKVLLNNKNKTINQKNPASFLTICY
jgi:hypothetical protein